MQFYSEPLGQRASSLCLGAPSHPWLSPAGIISHIWGEATSAKPVPPLTHCTIRLVGLVCLWVVAKHWHLQVSPHCPPDGESSPALVCDSFMPSAREESGFPEDSSVGTQDNVWQATVAVTHRQHLPAHHPFPAKEKGSRVCQGLWPLPSPLSITHLPHIPGKLQIYTLRVANTFDSS